MSGVDRLAEFNIGGVDEEVETQDAGKGTSSDIADHMKLYEPIKTGLEMIVAKVDVIDKLKEKDRTVANEKSRKEIMDSLDQIMSETTKTGRQIKNDLDRIKQENTQYEMKNKDSAKAQMRTNLYQTHIRRFHQVMNDYNAASHEFKQNLQERTRRQLKIVDSTISDEEIDEIVSSGQAGGVIKMALISENIQDVVRDIEERHLDILKLESQVLEVYELFKDLSTLVDIQQESLDVIEKAFTNAKAYTEKAETELKEAEQFQRKARNKGCIIMMICMGLLVAIVVPTILLNKDSM